jgi:hypothetical protein
MSAIFLDLPVVRFADGNHSKTVLADGVDAHLQAALGIAEAHQPLFVIVEPGIRKLEDPASKNLCPERERQMMVAMVGCVFLRTETDFHTVHHQHVDTLTAY